MSDTETTTIEAEEQQASERPDWLPENFKDPHALVKSYNEAVSQMHKNESRVQELERVSAENEQMREWIEAQQTPQPQPDDIRSQLAEAWDDPDRQVELVAYLANQVNQTQQQLAALAQQGPDPALTEVTAEIAMNKARADHPDWDMYHEQIVQVVQESPHILGNATTPAQYAKGLDLAYQVAVGRALATPEGQAAADAAEAARIAKQQAITQSGSSTRPATQSDDEAYAASLYEIARNSGGYGS